VNILGYKLQDFFNGFADAMAFSFVILTVAWNLGMPVAWEHALYAAGYGFSAYTMKRWLDLLEEVRS